MKVPEITIIFWIAKLSTTAFGEAFSDYIFFNDYIGQHPAMLMGLAFLILCLILQFRINRYVPWVYWLAVTAVSIFGTMSADFLNKDLGMPQYASTLMLLGFQAAIFIAWYMTERTLDVHSIYTRRRELFYWLTVLCTFGLGTAAGDFGAVTLGLGTLASTFVFLAVILIPAAGYKWLKLNEVLAFWFAYTITRPLGASFGDWLAVPAPYGDGLQLGTGPISLVLGIVLVGVVALIDRRYRRTSTPRAAVTGSAAPAGPSAAEEGGGVGLRCRAARPMSASGEGKRPGAADAARRPGPGGRGAPAGPGWSPAASLVPSLPGARPGPGRARGCTSERALGLAHNSAGRLKKVHPDR